MRELRMVLYEVNVWASMMAPWIFALAWIFDIYRTGQWDGVIFISLLVYAERTQHHHLGK